MFNARAVLFDLDGTLVDSTRSIENVWESWAVSNNINAEALLKCIHGSIGEDIISKFTPHLDPVIESRKLLGLEMQKVNESTIIPGVLATIKKLKDSNWAIVTSSTYELAMAKLKLHNIPIPDVLVTADDVNNAKPHPEPFLLAATKLNIPANECIAFEDSNTGIKSATDAGMDVVQVIYSNSIYNSKNSQAIKYINDFTEINFDIKNNNYIKLY